MEAHVTNKVAQGTVKAVKVLKDNQRLGHLLQVALEPLHQMLQPLFFLAYHKRVGTDLKEWCARVLCRFAVDRQQVLVGEECLHIQDG